MQVLDSTIANVAIPYYRRGFGASSSQGTWVITSFGVANVISIPITGWLETFRRSAVILILNLTFRPLPLGFVAFHTV